MNFASAEAKKEAKRMAMNLDFSEEKHKILNSELKQLYMVLTRAKVNVWIFDENRTNRYPIEQLWSQDKLIATKFDEKATNLAKKSSRVEWVRCDSPNQLQTLTTSFVCASQQKKAVDFLARHQYRLAQFCFKQSNDLEWISFAKGLYEFEVGKFDEAIKEFDHLFKLNQSLVEEGKSKFPKEKILDIQTKTAHCYFGIGKYTEAGGAFEFTDSEIPM